MTDFTVLIDRSHNICVWKQLYNDGKKAVDLGGFASMGPAFAPGGGHCMQIVHILAMIPWAFVGFEAVVHSSAEFRFPVRRVFGISTISGLPKEGCIPQGRRGFRCLSSASCRRSST